MLIIKPLNDINDLVIKPYMLPTGKVFTDVIDAVFIIKEDISDALSDAKIEKYKSNNEIIFENTDQVRVKFSISDYVDLQIGYNYIGKLLCKFTGQTDFDERIDPFDFQITKAMHNQL